MAIWAGAIATFMAVLVALGLGLKQEWRRKADESKRSRILLAALKPEYS